MPKTAEKGEIVSEPRSSSDNSLKKGVFGGIGLGLGAVIVVAIVLVVFMCACCACCTFSSMFSDTSSTSTF